MFRAHGGAAIAGKAGYALGCVFASLILVVSGFAYYVKSQVSSIGGSNVISGSPSVGAMNILLMGLESRTYWSGRPLPRSLVDVMHAGSNGGNATNTLILIHIFAGGQRAVGFSIPRDDWVDMVGTQGYGGAQGKIDQAYGFAMANKQNQLAGKGLSPGQVAWQGNEAGRLAAIETVQALTGVHIDHFAELNLLGFYRLAQVFGGIMVCLKKPAYDPIFSGAQIPAGYHKLNAAQALAFVRQRENLTNGDLDRTHRQQAVLDYVIWDLKHEGLLTDITQVTSLLDKAKTFLVTSGSWNIALFGTELQGLTGKNLTFQTAPITGFATEYPGGTKEDVNTVDPAAIKRLVHGAFYPPPAPKKPQSHSAKPPVKPAPIPPPSTVTVDVYNGGTTPLLAAHVSAAL